MLRHDLHAQLARFVSQPRNFGPGRYRMFGERAFEVAWDGLVLRANFSDGSIATDSAPRGRLLRGNGNTRRLDPWTAGWWIG